uniref:Uncharacterized protein n=1 Tax=Anopheles minimus TaxID=112268 RepID=A0A182WNF3_9DIPT
QPRADAVRDRRFFLCKCRRGISVVPNTHTQQHRCEVKCVLYFVYGKWLIGISVF